MGATVSEHAGAWWRRATIGIFADGDGAQNQIIDPLSRAGLGISREWRSLDELAAATGNEGLDALVLQLSDHGPVGGRIVGAARSALPGVPLIGVWQCSAEQPSRNGGDSRLLRLGLDGLVLSHQAESTLVPTLEAVLAGMVCLPDSMRRELSKGNLSSRERQILGMVVVGSTNAEIAERLFLAESTVKSHLCSAYDKLGVHSRKDATALILDPWIGLDRGILKISAA